MSVESNIACSVLQIIATNMVQLNWYSIPTPICTNGNSIFITIGALYRFGVLFPIHVSVRFYHFPFWKKIRMGIRTRNCIRSIAHFLDMVWMICGITSDKLRISRFQGSPYFVKFPLKPWNYRKLSCTLRTSACRRLEVNQYLSRYQTSQWKMPILFFALCLFIQFQKANVLIYDRFTNRNHYKSVYSDFNPN